MRRQVQPDAPRVTRHHRRHLEQLDAQRVDLRRGQLGALQGQRAQPLYQHVAQRGQQHAQLVRAQHMAARARGEQPYLRFLDPVLRLAALAVHAVVQRLGITGKVCHDEARVAALRSPFEPGDHAPLVGPALCGVVEFIDHALFGPAALVFVFHREFGKRHARLQPCIARQTHDVVHAGALAPVQDALAAEPGVGPKHDAHLRPTLAQPAHQQLEDGRSVLRRIDVAGPQVGAQQLLAAEHVQRQVAIAVVVTMEEASLLLAVQRVVGGIKVQHQLFGRALEAGDELIDQHLMQPPRRGPIGPLLQSAQRGGAGNLAVHANSRLHGHVTAQSTVVVEVFPAQRQAVHPLAQHVAHVMRDQQRIARIGDAARRRIHQAQLAIELAKQHDATIAGHAAAVEAPLHHASAQPAKVHGPNVNFFGTVWFRHCPLVDQDSTPGFSGTQGQCRPRLWLYYREISGLTR